MSVAATREAKTITIPQIILFKSGRVFSKISANTMDQAEYVIFSAIALDAPILEMAR